MKSTSTQYRGHRITILGPESSRQTLLIDDKLVGYGNRRAAAHVRRRWVPELLEVAKLSIDHRIEHEEALETRRT